MVCFIYVLVGWMGRVGRWLFLILDVGGRWMLCCWVFLMIYYGKW